MLTSSNTGPRPRRGQPGSTKPLIPTSQVCRFPYPKTLITFASSTQLRRVPSKYRAHLDCQSSRSWRDHFQTKPSTRMTPCSGSITRPRITNSIPSFLGTRYLGVCRLILFRQSNPPRKSYSLSLGYFLINANVTRAKRALSPCCRA